MKKMYVLLCVALILLLGSCADLSMDKEEALKADLPRDFKWKDYADINNDVAMSQIVQEIKQKGKGADSTKNCVNILSDIDFAEVVYLNYLQCPLESWDDTLHCTGKYGNNDTYSKAKTVWNSTKFSPDSGGLDTISWQCIIGSCLSGGWSKMKDSLPDSLTAYLKTPKAGLVRTMCQFIPDVSELEDAKSYLKNFHPDSTLIEQHYLFFGRSDGRPYKYCESGHFDPEKPKTLDLADKRGTGSGYYDYGRYTFCFYKTDDKIYVVK